MANLGTSCNALTALCSVLDHRQQITGFCVCTHVRFAATVRIRITLSGTQQLLLRRAAKLRKQRGPFILGAFILLTVRESQLKYSL